jgi:hypothetical protein
MRLKILGKSPQYKPEIPEIIKECQAHLSSIFGHSISIDSFFSNTPNKRKTAAELNDLLESKTTPSLGGSKSRKKKRGTRRRRRTRRMNKK